MTTNDDLPLHDAMAFDWDATGMNATAHKSALKANSARPYRKRIGGTAATGFMVAFGREWVQFTLRSIVFDHAAGLWRYVYSGSERTITVFVEFVEPRNPPTRKSTARGDRQSSRNHPKPPQECSRSDRPELPRAFLGRNGDLLQARYASPRTVREIDAESMV